MKLPNDDQQKLLREIRNGDVSAFDRLYWGYHKAVYTNIVRLVKDPDIAKDILQEVFITLWLKKETLNASVNIPGWLFTASYRKSIDHLRATVMQPLAQAELEQVESPVAETNNEDNHYQVMQLAVSQLSPQKRKVFELCKLKGKTYEETAQELNISKHTVKEYLTLAILQIKEYIHQLPKSTISVLFFLLFYPPVFQVLPF